MPYPKLTVDLSKIAHNAKLLADQAHARGISVAGVTKVTCGAPEVARAMLQGGVDMLADTRLRNFRKMQAAGIDALYLLLRAPMLSEVEEVVRLADISLNTEEETLKALSLAAGRLNKTHRVVLMVDLGDLREGIWPDDFIPFLRRVKDLPHLHFDGIGVNLTCYGGIIPTPENLGKLVALAKEAEEVLHYPLPIVSGGNSSSLLLLQSGGIPPGINHLRLGESIVLGRETTRREPVPGAYVDACVLQGEVIEVKTKPSLPVGIIGQDAFGHVPVFQDRGLMRRAIVAVGRQDIAIDGLTPVQPGIEVLGGSSDHLILNVTASPTPVRVGDVLEFTLSYGALLAAMTSPYLAKEYVSGTG